VAEQIREGNPMPALFRLPLVALLLAFASQAFAEPRSAGRYEMVRLHGGPDGKVLILDRQTGQLWTWSERQAAAYAGRIFPVAAEGAIARIITVPQDKR
jgi:hypothetical protein